MKKFIPPNYFASHFVNSLPFDHLNTLFSLNELNDWPTLDWLNTHCRAHNHSGTEISFVSNDLIKDDTRYYEQIIFESGFVPTRLECWHDLFGALIWCLFPKTKSLLNKRHIEEINKYGLKVRSKHRNALTLFDECGVLIAVEDATIFDELKAHNWNQVFINNKTQWFNTVTPFIFGHANYEMLTQPFIGLTGKAVMLRVDEAFKSTSLIDQYALVDSCLSTNIEIKGILNNNQAMTPLPLLGVPNWYEENKDPNFYTNTDYFRPKRIK